MSWPKIKHKLAAGRWFSTARETVVCAAFYPASLQSELPADPLQGSASLFKVEVVRAGQQRANVTAYESYAFGVKFPGNLSYLFGGLCPPCDSTLRTVFSVVPCDLTAEIREVPINGCAAGPEAPHHLLHRGRRGFFECLVEYWGHFRTVDAPTMPCPSRLTAGVHFNWYGS